MIIALQVVLLFVISASVVFYVWCGICLVWFKMTTKRKTNGVNQPVSLLVPVYGVDEGARENWASFCQQDYENYEVLFGVMNPQDPAVPILEEVVANFSDRSHLHFCPEVRGKSHKISNLMHLLEFAQHEIIVFADSDIRVSPDYLSTVTEPLLNPSVGVVTCGYLDYNPKSLGAALASLGRCIDFIPSALVAVSLEGGLRFAIGPTIVTRKSVLAKIGGLQTVVNRIGSDYHIGKLVSDAGYRVELSQYILQNDCGHETIQDVFHRELRWARTIRWNRGYQYYGLGLSYGTVYCLPLLLLSGFQTWAILVCLATVTLKVMQALVAIQSLNSPKLFRWLWTLPIREILSFAVWLGGCFGRRVYWRGQLLHIGTDGTIIE
jgi:ceramide glucosyltransferase